MTVRIRQGNRLVKMQGDNMRMLGMKHKFAKVCSYGRKALTSSCSRKHIVKGGAELLEDCSKLLLGLYALSNFRVQEFKFAGLGGRGVLIQIAKSNQDTEGSVLNSLTGLSLAVCVKLERHEDDLEVYVSGGKWVDKAFSGVVAWALFAPLLVVPGFGAWRQYALLRCVDADVVTWIDRNLNRIGAIDV